MSITAQIKEAPVVAPPKVVTITMDMTTAQHLLYVAGCTAVVRSEAFLDHPDYKFDPTATSPQQMSGLLRAIFHALLNAGV